MKILLQYPEGLRRKALEIASRLERDGNFVLLSAEPCWGACDIKDEVAKKLGCEKIVHIGHTKFIDSDFPVEYIEARLEIDEKRLREVFEAGASKIQKFENFGLTTSLQFLDYLPLLQKLLEERGKRVFVGKSADPQKIMHPGQILGCDVSAASQVSGKADCFIHVGSGVFHPLGIELKIDKPVFALDIEMGRLEDLSAVKEQFLRQRFTAIGLAKQARKFGILVSVKKGQKFGSAELIKKKLEEAGKEVHILVMDEVSEEKLTGLGLDCYVNTACPRIALDDRARFSKPIVNVDELWEAFFKG